MSCSDADLKAVFDSFDKDGKGTLSRKELKDALKLSDAGLDEILKDVDKNDDGEVDFAEFKVMHQDAELREAFNAFDADRSGSITQDELKKAMKNCGNNCSDKEIEDMIKKADKDGDGKVSFAEFKKMMGA